MVLRSLCLSFTHVQCKKTTNRLFLFVWQQRIKVGTKADACSNLRNTVVRYRPTDADISVAIETVSAAAATRPWCCLNTLSIWMASFAAASTTCTHHHNHHRHQHHRYQQKQQHHYRPSYHIIAIETGQLVKRSLFTLCKAELFNLNRLPTSSWL